MRILHLSDLHIGRRVNEFSMLDDQRHVLEGVLETIEERSIDVLLLAGDLYDKATPSAEAVALLDWFFDAGVQTGVKVLCVWGNHDSPERVAYARTLLSRQGIHISPVYDGTVERVDLDDEHGTVAFWLIPFLKPAVVRPFFPDAEISTYTDALRAALDTCHIDASIRNVALSHQYVTYGGEDTLRCDSEFSLGGMDNVDVGVYDPFDYVALGHVHRPQKLKREEVRYSGSLLKYSLSEAKTNKSAPLVTLGPKGEVDIELVPLVPLRDLREIKGKLEDLVSQGLATSQDADNYYKVVLTDAQPCLDALERLRTVFPNVMDVSYEQAKSPESQEGAGLTGTFETLSPFELFEAFYLKQNGNELTPSQREIVCEVLSETEVM